VSAAGGYAPIVRTSPGSRDAEPHELRLHFPPVARLRAGQYLSESYFGRVEGRGNRHSMDKMNAANRTNLLRDETLLT
jgi:hypothetical protein